MHIRKHPLNRRHLDIARRITAWRHRVALTPPMRKSHVDCVANASYRSDAADAMAYCFAALGPRRGGKRARIFEEMMEPVFLGYAPAGTARDHNAIAYLDAFTNLFTPWHQKTMPCIDALVRRYYEETERFDRRTCTGTPGPSGIPLPATAAQTAATHRNASHLHSLMRAKAALLGYTSEDLQAAKHCYFYSNAKAVLADGAPA